MICEHVAKSLSILHNLGRSYTRGNRDILLHAEQHQAQCKIVAYNHGCIRGIAFGPDMVCWCVFLSHEITTVLFGGIFFDVLGIEVAESLLLGVCHLYDH